MKIKTLPFLLFFITQITYSQEITGFVFNEKKNP